MNELQINYPTKTLDVKSNWKAPIEVDIIWEAEQAIIVDHLNTI